MERETFVSDGWRVKTTLLLPFGLIGISITDFVWTCHRGGPFGALVVARGIAFLAVTGILVSGWVHRKRPVLEISADSLEFGSIYPFGRRRTIALRELTGVGLRGGRILATTQSGKMVTIGAQTLSKESRQRAVQAIQRRLADLRPPSR